MNSRTFQHTRQEIIKEQNVIETRTENIHHTRTTRV